MTLQEIIKHTGGTHERGDLEGVFCGIASLDEASAESVSFLGNDKYHNDYLKTKAGVVLIPEGVELTEGESAIVRVVNPSFAFGEIIKLFSSNNKKIKVGVAPSAVVADDAVLDPTKVSVKAGAIIESGAKIGNGTEIGPNAVIGENVTIGENCKIYANVTIREYCEIGNRVILQPNCVIGSDGFGYELVDGEHKKVDQVGIVLLEDDVEIGSNSSIDRARFGKTKIGRGSKIDNLVQIAHNVQMGNHCLIVSQAGVAGSSKLGNYVTVAAQGGVVGHLDIGDQALLMGRAAATKDLAGGQAYMGFPARPVKEEHKRRAYVSRVPKLIEQVKELKKKLKEKE